MTGIPHDHPGAHGVDVDKELAEHGGTGDIGEVHIYTHLAVMTHPRMLDIPQVARKAGRLDDIARRMSRLRFDSRERLNITFEETKDHEALLRSLAKVMYEDAEGARTYVEQLVTQYFTYIGAAKREWRRIADGRFDEPYLWQVMTTYPNLAAVANALGLSMAETLVLVRTLADLDTEAEEDVDTWPEDED